MYNVCTKVEQNMKYPNKLFQVSLSKNEDVSCRYDFCIHASFSHHKDAFDYIIKLVDTEYNRRYNQYQHDNNVFKGMEEFPEAAEMNSAIYNNLWKESNEFIFDHYLILEDNDEKF